MFELFFPTRALSDKHVRLNPALKLLDPFVNERNHKRKKF